MVHRSGATLPTVAAFTLVVPLLATPVAAAPAAAAPVDPPRLPVQPPQYLPPPDPQRPWLAAGVTFAPSADEPDYDLYGFSQADADSLTRSTDPVLARTDAGDPVSSTQPAFSPDGSQVVFSAQQSAGAEAEWHLMIADVPPAADGPGMTNPRALDYPRVTGAADYQPAWSPDGQHLAFVREYAADGPRGQDGPQVQVLDLASGALTEVELPEDPSGMAEDYRWTAEPSWAPDGSGLMLVGSIGESTGTTFAPIDPDAEGTGSLWYYDLAEESVHQLLLSSPGCGGDVDPCNVPIDAETAAWSPDADTIAFVPWSFTGVRQLTLPDLPPAGTGDLVLTEDPEPMVTEADLPRLQDLAWDPDGSALFATVPRSPEVLRIADGEADWIYQDVDAVLGLLGLAVQPWSDLGITMEVPSNPAAGTTTTATAEVTNAGPSPSRAGQVQIEVPAPATVGALPPGCTGPAGQVITCELEPMNVGESTTLALDLTFTSPAAGTIFATVTSASPDPGTTGSADNVAEASVVAYAPPDGRSQRISFTLDRRHSGDFVQPFSEDLVQTLVPAAGDDPSLAYRVLADEVYDGIEPPGPDPITGRFLADEDSLDYSPDGSRVVYTRWSQQNDYGDSAGTDFHELVVADVAGTQAEDDEPGAFLNTQIVDSGFSGSGRSSLTEPSWSPDGGQIAVIRSDEDGGRLYLYSLADIGATAYEPVSWDLEPSQEEPDISDATWAPDGTGLIFSADTDTGQDTLWFVPLAGGPNTPQPVTDPEGEQLIGQSPAWSPAGTMLAFIRVATETDADSLFLAGLPESLPEGAPVATTAVARATQFDDLGFDQPLVTWDPTWSPDGSQVAVATREFATEGGLNQIMALQLGSGAVDDVPAAAVSTLFTAGFEEWLASPEYEPSSDIGVTLDPGGPAQTGSSTELTMTVSNNGPSPARDATVVVTLDSGLTTGALPEECSAEGRTLSCSLSGPIPADTEVPVTIPVSAGEDGRYTLTATAVTNSIDPSPGNDEATATLVAVTGESERIAFSLWRPADVPGDVDQDESLDLVRSLTAAPGEAAATDYVVLAAAVLAEVAAIGEPGTDLGPLPATEDNLDYSADGSRAVFNRSADTQYGYTDDQRLVIADVVGTQQSDLGEPGALINLEEVADSPGSLPGDSGGADRVSDTEPVWSPDGTQIAFVRMVTANDGEALGRIMLLGADDRAMTSPFDAAWLASTAGTEHLSGRMTSPTWAPDGDALIYGRQGPGDDAPVLHYLPLSTGIPHPLALPTDASVCWPGFGGDWCDGPVQGFEPAWSPDGDQVAFGYWASGGLGVAVLTLDAETAERALEVDSTVPLPIAGLAGVAAFLPDGPDAPPAGSPTWSPDGQRIAAAVGSSDYVDEIAAVHLATGERTTMYRTADIPTDVAHPEFEPYSDLAVQIARPGARLVTGTPVPVTVTVTNRGPSPARDAVLTLTLPAGASAGTLPAGCTAEGRTAEGRTLTCTLPGPIPVGAEQPLTVPVTFADAGEHPVRATVTTNSRDLEAGNNTATRSFTVTTPDNPEDPTGRTGPRADLQVELSLSADRAWLGGTGLPAQVTVTNLGTAPARGVELSTALPAEVLLLDAGPCPLTGPCDLGTLASGGQVQVDLVLQPGAVGQLEVTASATSTTPDPRTPNNTDTAAFEAVQAELRLLPAVAEPGEVTLLYGVDLPPDAQITVRWSEGVTTRLQPIAAADDGTLRAPVLIVDGDQLGRRDLQVTTVSGTVFGLESMPTMLVVPQSVAPPNFLGRS